MPRPRPKSSVLVVLGMKGLGDAVEAFPAFELITRHRPGTRVEVGYFKDKQETLLRASPHVSSLVRLHGDAKDPTKSIRHVLVNALLMRGHEAILFLYKKESIAWPLLLSARLTGARVLHRHGYRYRDVRRNALSDFPEHVFFQMVTSNLLLGRPLGGLGRPRLVPGPQEREYAQRFFAEHRLGDRPTVIFNARAPKYAGMGRWGLLNFARTAHELRKRGAHVVFNGGLEEQVSEFEGLPEGWRDEMVVLPPHSPLELAAVIERCDLFVGEPSGPTFLATAVGTPALTLQGPGDKQYPGQNRAGAVWWPRDGGHRTVSRVEWCQLSMGSACLCSYAGHPPAWERAMKRVGVWEAWKSARKALRPPRPRRVDPLPRYPCLEAITVEEVVDAAAELLEGRLAPARARRLGRPRGRIVAGMVYSRRRVRTQLLHPDLRRSAAKGPQDRDDPAR